ncbi:MAG: hypothetical protein V4487_03045 [Chlamydiota bacterium]
MYLTVKYDKELNISQIIDKIGNLNAPHIILWYIGTSGLKKWGAEFYRDLLITPILNINEKATLWLVDLTAWGALKNPKISIKKYSNHATTIDNLNNERINCIKSSDIFNKIKSITEQHIINYLEKALSRNFIWQASANIPSNHLNIRDLFENSCCLLSKFYDFTTSKSYSMLQYLEGCLLVEEIIHKTLNKVTDEKEIQIVFALPNDEIKYYQDETNCFEKDLKFIISNLHNKKTNDIKITVTFFSFKYGEFSHQRPYNAPGKTLKKNELTSALGFGNNLISEGGEHVAAVMYPKF